MFRRHPALVTALIAVACHAPDGRHPNTLERTSSGYPHKPISIMAPTNPGGGWDQTARLVQQVWTSERILPVPVEVTNRGGAGGTIGLAEFVSKNRNDPHTIMTMGRVMLGAIITNQSAVTLSDTVPLARLLSEYEVVAVAGSSGYRTFQQLIDDFKKDPKRVSWGGGSAGGTDHILVGMIAQAAGVGPKNINYVAYAGGGEAAAAVMGGHVSAGVSGYGEWKAHVDAGKMRFLAVSSEKRIGNDSTPTIKESGLDIVLANWRSIVAPPGTDRETRNWLVQALTRMHDSPAWQEILKKNDWDDTFLAGDAFAKFLEEENVENLAILKVVGLIQ